MANRKVPFVTGEHYHLYNRGIDKRNIFSNQKDLDRFLQSMIEFNTLAPIGSIYENSFAQLGGETSKLKKAGKGKAEKLIDFISYCINPNHYHFIVKQACERGIEKFMHRLGTGYTMYFNEKEERSGSLFQGVFKSIHVNSNEYLLHLSAYVNLNDRVHQLGGETSKLVKSKSSWGEYVGNENANKGICEKDIILEQFKNRKEYKEFALESLEAIKQRKKELEDIKEFLLE
ncbi:MAG: transposase [Patescibacteria group bacterium]